MRISKFVAIWGSFASFGLLAGAARADVSVEACSDAYTKGQEERLAGHLYSARTLLNVCSDPTCPTAIVRDCERWVTEVAADLPTVLVHATDAAGRPINDLKITVDGANVAVADLAKPFVLDVGQHVLRFEAAGYEPLEVQPSLRPRDHEVPVNAVLHLNAPPQSVALAPLPGNAAQSSNQPSKPVPVAAVALASVGVVALGTSIYFGLSAKSKYDDLKAECAPNCSQSSADSVHTKAVVSDVALGATIVAFGAAAWFYFGASPNPQSATALGVEPTRDGARARLRIAF